ncbi:GNAT family N-acetyltransferase [Chromohalobacter nigrandesensis]|uniref:GNAT family N-acetyltransferase n=1 Tax=Chromohalobacter nigrandesensis TaxID=119863 RepID=UPI001FF5F0E5|nr:GNAT family N-acetyltransferase [Chromohalobacter nigrandesensis]MCK0743705.1 GNAT family N-acetyltransferase [Chromohalobacter nigrandesensis]
MCDEADEPKETLGQDVIEAARVDPPVVIAQLHEVDKFDCGRHSLNDFLKDRGVKNTQRKATTTYVVCYEGTSQVAGYFSLATGAVLRDVAPKNMRRNMPTELPVIKLGRLAVDQPCQGAGLGGDLLGDAIERSLIAAGHVAARALIVDALDEDAAAFYKKHGFLETPDNPLMLFLSLKTRGG